MKISSRGGYIAITSAVVIAVLLLAITLSLSFTGFVSRFNILNMEYKERSLALAEACADTALLKLAANREYSGEEIISIGNLTCTIFPVSTSGGQITIKTKASFPENGAEKAVTNLVVTLGRTNLNIISWEEVPKQI